MPVVSVILPAYNAAATLERCVRSIQTQSFSDFELVLVDDGSTDGSGALCDELAAADGRLCVLHQPNGGVAAARNAGLAVSTGAYLCFVDSDDYLLDGYLDILLGAAETHKADVAACSYVWHARGEETVLPLQSGLFTQAQLRANIAGLGHDALTHPVWNKLYRRCMLLPEGPRFDPALSIGEDWCVNLQVMARCETIALVAQPLYMYEERAVSAMNRPRPNFVAQHKAVLAKALAFFTPSPGPDKAVYLLKQWVYAYRHEVLCAPDKAGRKRAKTAIVRDGFYRACLPELGGASLAARALGFVMSRGLLPAWAFHTAFGNAAKRLAKKV